MNADLSVAPEIAQLAAPFIPAVHVTAVPRTDGRIAGDLADLAAAPQRWWDLVRFDDRGPVRIPLPDAPGTWLLVLPCAVRAVVQWPIWLGGHSGSVSADTAVAALGVLKIVMGWPLQLAGLAAMSWLLGRNHTPLEASAVSPARGQG